VQLPSARHLQTDRPALSHRGVALTAAFGRNQTAAVVLREPLVGAAEACGFCGAVRAV
jgi:hypothetical protein